MSPKGWIMLEKIAIITLAVVVLFALCSIFIPLARENMERQRKVAALEEELHANQEAIATLRRQQEKFQTDPTFVENIAREELGKARPGETIYRFTK